VSDAEALFLTHWIPRPLPKRLGGRWRSKVARESTDAYREREALRKRERYAANLEAERAKARARYRADPSQLERKLVRNMTCQQRVRAAKADRRKYLRNRQQAIASATKHALDKRRATALLRAVLDVLEGRPASFHPKQTFG